MKPWDDEREAAGSGEVMEEVEGEIHGDGSGEHSAEVEPGFDAAPARGDLVQPEGLRLRVRSASPATGRLIVGLYTDVVRIAGQEYRLLLPSAYIILDPVE